MTPALKGRENTMRSMANSLVFAEYLRPFSIQVTMSLLFDTWYPYLLIRGLDILKKYSNKSHGLRLAALEIVFSLTHRGDFLRAGSQGWKASFRYQNCDIPRSHCCVGEARHSKGIAVHQISTDEALLEKLPRFQMAPKKQQLLATFRAKQFVRLLWLNSARVDLLPFKFTLTGITYHFGIFLGGFHLSFQWFERFVRLLQWPFKSQQKSYRERRIHEV